ncbi:MAG TPA: hypothetical protein VIK91_28165, partial [Nannocystis sp.]
MPRAALALALVLLACGAPGPAPAGAPAQPAAAAPAERAAPAPQNSAARAHHPLCDPAAAALAALRTRTGDAPVVYTGTPLQQWIAASDRALGRQDDAAITASLADTSPAGAEYTRALIEAAIAQWMRDHLRRAGEGREEREAAWTAAHCAWELGLRPLAADVADTDPGLAEAVDRAFAEGEIALAGG